MYTVKVIFCQEFLHHFQHQVFVCLLISESGFLSRGFARFSTSSVRVLPNLSNYILLYSFQLIKQSL
jgi:hypothetical protein